MKIKWKRIGDYPPPLGLSDHEYLVICRKNQYDAIESLKRNNTVSLQLDGYFAYDKEGRLIDKYLGYYWCVIKDPKALRGD